MTWRVQIAEEFEPELSALPLEVRRTMLAHSRLLREYGPQLGRPRADTLNGSRHANMKEIRFSAASGKRGVAGRLRVRSRAPRHASGGGRQVGRQRTAVLSGTDP